MAEVLHGRDGELGTVHELVEKARAGIAGTLLIRGDAGVGKSALLDAAVAQATQDPETEILRCAGTECEGGLSYSGLHQILLPVLHLMDAVPAAQATALRRVLGEDDGPVNHFAVCVATFALLTSATENRPLLLVVDDLQWLDAASTSALLFTARRLQADPVAVLFALRESSDTTLRGVPELVLGGLDPAAARGMLAARGWRASAVVTDALVTATGGNPLALTELARTGVSGPLAQELLLGGTVPLGRRLQATFGRRTAELPGDGPRRPWSWPRTAAATWAPCWTRRTRSDWTPARSPRSRTPGWSPCPARRSGSPSGWCARRSTARPRSTIARGSGPSSWAGLAGR